MLFYTYIFLHYLNINKKYILDQQNVNKMKYLHTLTFE